MNKIPTATQLKEALKIRERMDALMEDLHGIFQKEAPRPIHVFRPNHKTKQSRLMKGRWALVRKLGLKSLADLPKPNTKIAA